MRIVFMGTGGFAVPTFRRLIESEHEVTRLFTRPPKPVHRRKKENVLDNPMRAAAEEYSIDISMPNSINDVSAVDELRQIEPDLLVVCDYGQILSKEALSVSRLGGINLHGSLLPKYRGAAPINWAIYNGEAESGICVIHMTPKLDAGPCLVIRSTPIGPNENAIDLESRLSELGVDAVVDAIDELSRWDGSSPIGEIQDKALATKAPRLKKSDGAIDWNRSSQQIFDQIRAFKPWPGTFTELSHGGKSIRLIVETASICDESGEPGSVMRADSKGICVACGQGAMVIETLKPAGKRLMTAEEFMRGHPVEPGDLFSSIANG